MHIELSALHGSPIHGRDECVRVFVGVCGCVCVCVVLHTIIGQLLMNVGLWIRMIIDY